MIYWGLLITHCRPSLLEVTKCRHTMHGAMVEHQKKPLGWGMWGNFTMRCYTGPNSTHLVPSTSSISPAWRVEAYLEALEISGYALWLADAESLSQLFVNIFIDLQVCCSLQWWHSGVTIKSVLVLASVTPEYVSHQGNPCHKTGPAEWRHWPSAL